MNILKNLHWRPWIRWASSCFPSFVYLALSSLGFLTIVCPRRDIAFVSRMENASIVGWLIPISFCIGFANDRKRWAMRKAACTQSDRLRGSFRKVFAFASTLVPTAALLPTAYIFVEFAPFWVEDGATPALLSALAVCLVLFLLSFRNDRERFRLGASVDEGCNDAMRAAWMFHGGWIVLLVLYVACFGCWRRSVVENRLPLELSERARAFRWAETGSERSIFARALVSSEQAWRQWHPHVLLSPEAWISRLGPPDATNRVGAGVHYEYRIDDHRILALRAESDGSGTLLSLAQADDVPLDSKPQRKNP